MGKKKSKSTTTTSPWAPAQPYLLGAAKTIQDTVNAHQPQLDALTNDLVGRLPAMYNEAFDASKIQPGFDYANDVLGGKYLNANPYTTAMTQQIAILAPASGSEPAPTPSLSQIQRPLTSTRISLSAIASIPRHTHNRPRSGIAAQPGIK